MKTNLFGIHEQALQFRAVRNQILSSNIANSDTPNFRPSDLNADEFRRALRSHSPNVDPRTTHAAHLRGTVASGGPARAVRQDKAWETSPSGNAVILEEQLIKVSKTQSDYQTMVNLYRKHMDMFRTALRGS